MAIYIGLAILLLMFIGISILLIITILKGKKGKRRNAVYEGGYNTGTGLKESSSGKLFSGLEKITADTICVEHFKNEDGMKMLKIYNCNSGELYEIMISKKLYIGRNPSLSGNTDYLYIAGDNSISKMHCMIENNSNGMFLEDCNSSNHTYLNGKKIQEKVMLQSNDMIKIGKTKIRIIYSA